MIHCSTQTLACIKPFLLGDLKKHFEIDPELCFLEKVGRAVIAFFTCVAVFIKSFFSYHANVVKNEKRLFVTLKCSLKENEDLKSSLAFLESQHEAVTLEKNSQVQTIERLKEQRQRRSKRTQKKERAIYQYSCKVKALKKSLTDTIGVINKVRSEKSKALLQVKATNKQLSSFKAKALHEKSLLQQKQRVSIRNCEQVTFQVKRELNISRVLFKKQSALLNQKFKTEANVIQVKLKEKIKSEKQLFLDLSNACSLVKRNGNKIEEFEREFVKFEADTLKNTTLKERQFYDLNLTIEFLRKCLFSKNPKAIYIVESAIVSLQKKIREKINAKRPSPASVMFESKI